MTVGELIEKLKELPAETLAVCNVQDDYDTVSRVETVKGSFWVAAERKRVNGEGVFIG